MIHYIQPCFEVLKRLSKVRSCNDKRIQLTCPFPETSIVTTLSIQVAYTYKAVPMHLVFKQEQLVNKAAIQVTTYTSDASGNSNKNSYPHSYAVFFDYNQIVFKPYSRCRYIFLTVKIYSVIFLYYNC